MRHRFFGGGASVPRVAIVTLALALVVLCSWATQAVAMRGDKILMSNVKVLTLQKGKMTTGRRSSPVPQLTCVGGDAQGQFDPASVLCSNMGYDGHDYTWKCEADLPKAYRLGTVTVSCEGYDYPDDEYILAGSCGLEYTLEYTGQGSEYGGDSYSSTPGSRSYGSKQGGSTFFTWVMIAILGFLFYNMCMKPRNAGNYNGAGGLGGPGGPGGPGWGGGGGGGGGGNPYFGAGSYGAAPGAGLGGGGFWTGMGAGGLLGYFLGNRNRGHGYGGGYMAPQRPSWGGAATHSGVSLGGGGGGSGATGHSTSYGGTRRR